ncbi:glycosyl transferase family 4 [Candidatus Pacearchaeota archaeon]|nr:glycosyl transferase family 4 [Candidatus Pacearchaeota archaeon]
MDILLILIIFASFLSTLLVMPAWIRKAKQIDLIWEDMNKLPREKNVAGSGGITVVLGAIVGIFLYIALQTFYFKSIDGTLVSIFAIICSVLLVSGIGFIDDLFGWKMGGLSIRSRIFLVLFSAIPLMVINAGESTIFGINLGIIYPLIIIPLGILGATTTYNFLAGFNGLESSQGIIILSALAFVTYVTGNSWLSIILLCMVASLLAFYIFNKNPAKVFPGDVLTYSVGTLIAITAILGNIEKITVFFFIPYILEMIFKSRGKLKKHSFGTPNPDGSLEMPYEKIYGLEHLAIKILKKIKPNHKAYESEVVWLINGFQILIILIGLLLFLQ